MTSPPPSPRVFSPFNLSRRYIFISGKIVCDNATLNFTAGLGVKVRHDGVSGARLHALLPIFPSAPHGDYPCAQVYGKNNRTFKCDRSIFCTQRSCISYSIPISYSGSYTAGFIISNQFFLHIIAFKLLKDFFRFCV